MEKALLVAAGGFIGTLMRYGVGVLVGRIPRAASFPWTTLIVNVCGCLAIGVLAGLWESRGMPDGTARAILFIGVLGGFTTFSSLGYETFVLVRLGQVGAAAASIGVQLVFGLAAVWLGFGLASGARTAV